MDEDKRVTISLQDLILTN